MGGGGSRKGAQGCDGTTDKGTLGGQEEREALPQGGRVPGVQIPEGPLFHIYCEQTPLSSNKTPSLGTAGGPGSWGQPWGVGGALATGMGSPPPHGTPSAPQGLSSPEGALSFLQFPKDFPEATPKLSSFTYWL